MSAVYTYSEARQNLASLLDKATREGEIRVRRKDGQLFVITPVATDNSPLDVEGIDLGLSKEEIIAFIYEGRKYLIDDKTYLTAENAEVAEVK